MTLNHGKPPLSPKPIVCVGERFLIFSHSIFLSVLCPFLKIVRLEFLEQKKRVCTRGCSCSNECFLLDRGRNGFGLLFLGTKFLPRVHGVSLGGRHDRHLQSKGRSFWRQVIHPDVPVALVSETEMALSSWLRSRKDRKGEFLHIEEIVSGPGLVTLFRFLDPHAPRPNAVPTDFLRRGVLVTRGSCTRHCWSNCRWQRGHSKFHLPHHTP